MKVDIRIHRWGSDNSCRLFYIGNYGRTLDQLHRLQAEARKHFPDLTDEETDFGVVQDTGYMKGFVLISFMTTEEAFKATDLSAGRMDFHWA